MRRRPRRAPAILAATLAAIPSRIVVEVAVVAAFALILLAIATPGDHRNADASAAHSAVQRLKAGGRGRPEACPTDARGQPRRTIVALAVDAPQARCRDLQSFV